MSSSHDPFIRMFNCFFIVFKISLFFIPSSDQNVPLSLHRFKNLHHLLGKSLWCSREGRRESFKCFLKQHSGINLPLKHSLIIHEQNTKEITTVAVVLYLIKHMWIITKLLLRFSRRIQHLYWKFFRKQTDKMGIKWIVFKPFNIPAIRALSDIIRSAAPRVLYLIKHSCSYIKYYLFAFFSGWPRSPLFWIER